MTAIKHDNTKADLSLIPQVVLRRLAEAMQVGEKKYGRYNYCGGMEASRLVGAMLRHATAWNDGEDFDADGQHHLGSVLANCLMILRQEELGTLIDNRFQAPLAGIAWELWAKGGTGKDATIGTYNSIAEAAIALSRVAPEWPTFTLYIKAITNGHS